jgi:uncharacterized protein (TIGR02757 family)
MPQTIQELKDRGNLIDCSNLKHCLDQLYGEINKSDFILSDPVQFPHRYKDPLDREIAAFLVATIAWGRRDLILKSAEKMFALMGQSPHAFVMKGNYRKIGNGSARGSSIHRTFFDLDLLYFCRGLKACYAKYGSLENLFASAPDIWEGISVFRETMAWGNSNPGKQPVYSKHIANPVANSACKRLHLALRWLVRGEGPVDLGQWKKISPAELFIPLDLHVGRTARQLGLLERKTNDKKAVIALTERLREFCPEDPVKYDLALFGYSVRLY